MAIPAVAPAFRKTIPAVPRALPAWAYGHAELQRLELDRVLLPSWQIVCHVNSIPAAGDYLTFDVGPESVIVLRDRDGSIKGFHNACRHRGARILDGAGNCPGPMTCPYHGWSYRQDGSLVGVPIRDSFPGLDRAQLGLRQVRTGTLLGFVFVALRGNPPPLAEAWGPLAAELAPYRIEEMVPLGPITEDVWNVDWKLAMDNYLESYHVPIGHPGLYRMFTPDFDDQRSHGTVARGAGWMRDKESPVWSERMYQRLVGSIATHLPEAQRRCWSSYSVLPNLGIDIFPEQIDFFQILPRGPGKCVIRGALFGLPDSRPEMKALRYLGNRITTQVNKEDQWLCARVQRGLASSSYEPGPLSNIERWMLGFHDLLRERIPELALAKPPQQFAATPQPRCIQADLV